LTHLLIVANEHFVTLAADALQWATCPINEGLACTVSVRCVGVESHCFGSGVIRELTSANLVANFPSVGTSATSVRAACVAGLSVDAAPAWALSLAAILAAIGVRGLVCASM
jgi:hypothetical protein